MKKRLNAIFEHIVIGIIAFLLIFVLLIAPCAVSYGVITGHLDIETLEPIKNEVDYEGN